MIETTSAGLLALALYRGWLNDGAKARHVRLLPLISALADDRLAPHLRRQIEEWGPTNRRNLAASLLRTLAQMESETARRNSILYQAVQAWLHAPRRQSRARPGRRQLSAVWVLCPGGLQARMVKRACSRFLASLRRRFRLGRDAATSQSGHHLPQRLEPVGQHTPPRANMGQQARCPLLSLLSDLPGPPVLLRSFPDLMLARFLKFISICGMRHHPR